MKKALEILPGKSLPPEKSAADDLAHRKATIKNSIIIHKIQKNFTKFRIISHNTCFIIYIEEINQFIQCLVKFMYNLYVA